ncbi:hypothetical protein J2Z60_000459 [Lactobacillus colini]|uniref:Uncharacterized protein n=1 Tax=Lactobacillus colini TaxID=1819254 RepID=A0ABS4MC77_9LACO|nr:hypothetical protein [Lactobacillus colini]MBP2057295.1 hypothetical protein [Lactobacillus colini]
MTTIEVLKWIVVIVLSSKFGTFFCNICTGFFENVWIPRFLGGVAAVVVGLVLYSWLFKSRSQSSQGKQP